MVVLVFFLVFSSITTYVNQRLALEQIRSANECKDNDVPEINEEITTYQFTKTKTIIGMPKDTQYSCTNDVSVQELNCETCKWWFKSETGECAFVREVQ